MKPIKLLILLYVGGLVMAFSQLCRAEEPLSLDTVQANQTVTVSGTAVDESGQPIPNLVLQPQSSQQGGALTNIPSNTTDKNGYFTIKQLVPGSYFIDAGPNWTVVSPVAFNAPSTVPIKLVLKKTLTTTLQGTAVDTADAPLEGVSITFQTTHTLSNGGETSNTAQATTDSTGFFSLPDVPAGHGMAQLLTIAKDGYILKSGGVLTYNGDQPAISLIVMAKLDGQVSGIVRNGLGAPVSGAWIACPNGGGDVRPIQTDASGHFQFSNLESGPVDLYAAKGNYYGHQTAQASAVPTEPVTINLSPKPEQPTPVDLVGATQILTEQCARAKASASGDVWRYCDECAYVLEAVSPTAGMSFLEQNTQIGSRDLSYIAPAQASQNPTGTANWVIPLLSSLPDNGYTGSLAASLGREVAPYDTRSATTLYNIAVAKIPLNNVNRSNIFDAMGVVALAYAIQSPDADADYTKVLAEINRENAADNVNANDPWANGLLMSEFAEFLAKGDLNLALQILPKLSKQVRNFAISVIVSDLEPLNPKGALALFQALDRTDPNNSPYNESFISVLPILFKADPIGTIAQARVLSDNVVRSEALTYIADQQPLNKAEPLYEEAETDSVDQFGQGTTPASIAAHAFLRDKIFGATLFKEAYDKVIGATPSNQPFEGPAYAEFAFYYARYNPGYSRMLIENQFARDNVPAPNFGQKIELGCDVAAMASIDPVRALEMAADIKDFHTSFEAALKVARYLTFTQQVRDTLPFDAWTFYSLWVPTPGGIW